MSTYQPPGGQPPEGTPAYPQPQDPWSGEFDQGLASVPTDPIPQQYDPYAQGTGPGDVWSQETAPHVGQAYGYPPAAPAPGRKVGVVIAVFLAVIVLGGGGGYAAWYVTTDRTVDPQVSASPTVPPTATSDSKACVQPNGFDPCTLAIGDCFQNNGTNDRPDLKLADCKTPKSFKVIKLASGADLPEGPNGKFDADTTSVAVCKDTKFESWYGYKDPFDDKKDLFFCLTNNK